MSEKERRKIIEYIKANDHSYNYSAVNFKYYSEEELLELKKRLEHKNRKRRRSKTFQFVLVAE